MDAFVILCDFAEVVNGKLYIMGGGWSDVVKVQPLTFAVATKIDLPYDRTNEKLLVEARLVDADGHAIRVLDQEVVVHMQVEVGRPPGIKPGAPIVVPLAWRFVGLDLPPGEMSWHVLVQGEEVASAAFTVHPSPNLPASPTP